VALNEILAAPRISRDIDLFHDTEEALAATWEADRRLLEGRKYGVRILRERPSFVEAEISDSSDVVLIQWARDSAFRFFPLVTHDELGLTLHPFDLATNKVLALVGRLEVRDWVDVIHCHETVQPLGYLAWAACGKDPGFGPASILEEAARSSRYSAEELRQLAFAGAPPDAAQLSRAWHAMLADAREIAAALPADDVGDCVLTPAGALYRGSPSQLARALASDELRFHRGTIRGAFPQVSPR
jgi:hypothetical protein